MLKQFPSVDYFLVRPAPLLELGLVFGGEAHRALHFREMRNQAFERGDKMSVVLMYEWLDSEVKTTPACAAWEGLDAQITREFGFTMKEIQEETKTLDRFWDDGGAAWFREASGQAMKLGR